MPYKIRFGDVVIECDTPDEAIAIASRQGKIKGRIMPGEGQASHSGEESSRWTMQRFTEFFKSLQDQPKKVLNYLLESHGGRTQDEILKMLGLQEGRALAGILSGITKNSKNMGFTQKDIYEKTTILSGNKMIREYKIADSFREAAMRFSNVEGG